MSSAWSGSIPRSCCATHSMALPTIRARPARRWSAAWLRPAIWVANPAAASTTTSPARCTEPDAMRYQIMTNGVSRSFPGGDKLLEGAAADGDILVLLGARAGKLLDGLARR